MIGESDNHVAVLELKPEKARAERDAARAERDAARAERDTLKAEVLELRELVAELKAQVSKLQQGKRSDSSNSGRPPSSDLPASRSKRRKKKKSGRKRGGQPGHKGSKRELVPPEEVNEFRDYYAAECGCCGVALPEQKSAEPRRHQVFELPKLSVHVFEHRMHDVTCLDCSHVTKCPHPAGVPLSSFGPRLTSVVGLLTGVYRLGKRRVVDLLQDLAGIHMSLGSVSNCERRVSEALASAVQEAHRQVQSETIKHTDATGWFESGEKRSLWVVASALLSVFVITSRGTREAVKSVLGEAHGILVSDRASVFLYWKAGNRQFCWAHLKRAFQAMSERDDEPAQIVGEVLVTLTNKMFGWWHRVRDGTLARSSFRTYLTRHRRVFEGHLALGVRSADAQTRRTCANLIKLRQALWTFARIEGVEPTNNHAEQQLRGGVIWRKLSFGTQSERGTRFVERILTAVHTLRKQKRDVLGYLTEACSSAVSSSDPPSLIPPPG